MPTNGMTIDSLNTVSALTAQDEVPVWDKESSGEPTRKITAQNMANSVKTLGSLVNTTEMNAAIAQSTTIQNVALTYGNGVSYVSGGCYRMGKLVVVALRLNITTVPSDHILATGLPAPKHDGSYVSAYVRSVTINGNVAINQYSQMVAYDAEEGTIIINLSYITND